MAKPDTLLLDGHAYSWQRLCELRRQQLEAWRAAQPQQPALFVLGEDFRPAAERTAAGRFQEPSLFANITHRADPLARYGHQTLCFGEQHPRYVDRCSLLRSLISVSL
jgi:hypothetical protein